MDSLSLITVVTAAAVDSINPCAIGVLIFLVTFLASQEGTRARKLAIGLTYILVVFLCYFTLGIGLVKVLAALSFLKIIYKVIGGIVLIAGLIDIIDGITKNPKPLLSIPVSKSPKIKELIHKSTIPAAIALGGFVSLFELPCTGGPYFIITGMISRDGLDLRNAGLLALYNIVFVLPLIIILLLGVFGLSTEKLESWRKKNRGGMRILIGLAMMVLGLLMIFDTI